MTYAEAGHALSVHPNSLRYAAATGTVLIRWEGARAPTIWTVPPPRMSEARARLELARRYLHVYGPTTGPSFRRWAGIGTRGAAATFEGLTPSLTPVRTPIGDAWILTEDEPSFRADPGPVAPARLLPSGDAYYLLHGPERDLLVTDLRGATGSGPRACGRGRCSSTGRSSAPGGVRTRRCRSSRGVGCRVPHARPSKSRQRRSRSRGSTTSSSPGTTEGSPPRRLRRALRCGVMRTCPRCEEENPDRARFCLNCGEPLDAPEPAPARAQVRDRPVRRPRRVDDARRAARTPRWSRRSSAARSTGWPRRSPGTKGCSRSSWATRSWRSSASRARTRTTPNARCAPRWRCRPCCRS